MSSNIQGENALKLGEIRTNLNTNSSEFQGKRREFLTNSAKFAGFAMLSALPLITACASANSANSGVNSANSSNKGGLNAANSNKGNTMSNSNSGGAKVTRTQNGVNFVKVGNTDIEISQICIGAMSFGKAGTLHDWTLNEKDSEAIIKHALDKGLNFFDTANVYSAGTSEEYLGKALKKHAKRENVVISSKVYFNKGVLSRAAILREIDGTLKRLGTDYLDIYIIHRFDYTTPILETMQALHEVVKAGKVRALGASAMFGYQFMNMQQVARDNKLTPFSIMQNHYNLLYREDEREMIPICKEQNVTLMPYSPLASGRLARTEWKSDTLRSKTDKTAVGKYDKMQEQDKLIAARVNELAKKKGVSMSGISLAWLLAKGVGSPIIGANKTKYIDEAVSAMSIKLTSDEIAFLEAPYVPHEVVGANTEEQARESLKSLVK